MENLDFIKLYCFLSFIILLLLWKFWKDFEFKNKYFIEVEKSNENQAALLKEIESLSIEISDNSKKIDNLTGYLKRLDQNASRLADDIRGEQAMTKAIEMARRGQDHLDIIKATGLSNEEVEAIIHSHKDN
jgi:predicted  nucleic acid-binding Zn-ribbon protein